MKQETIYQVIFDGHIHTIIPAENDVPAGWKTTGRMGTKDLCLEYIDEVMRNSIVSFLRNRGNCTY
ncbi:MAG: MbtH family NRPS accessory protein [Flectobacillus sp.]|uniref:MbtH family NRPS accessory protein n=1 Tax=Flectobacillus sp. TaxID=50419 RepID=UPI003B9CAB0F